MTVHGYISGEAILPFSFCLPSLWRPALNPLYTGRLSRRAVVSYWGKYMHKVLVNHLGGLSLPRKSVVRLTDRPDMTLDVYRGRKTTMQHVTYW